MLLVLWYVMRLLNNRLVRGYAILVLGVLALLLRRLLASSQLDAAPPAIGIRSLVWQCYMEGVPVACSEPIITGLIFLLLIPALGGKSLPGLLIAIALLIPPAAFYFMLAPSWAGLILLLLPPLAYLLLDRWLPQVLDTG